MHSINSYSIYCTCPGQSFSVSTPTLQREVPKDFLCSLYPLALHFSLTHIISHTIWSPKYTQTSSYLSHRRRWRFAPLSSPPGRCSGPCEQAEPWGCAAWTSRGPFSPPAPSAGPPAATASPSHPGNAARRVRWARRQGGGRRGWWWAWCCL